MAAVVTVVLLAAVFAVALTTFYGPAKAAPAAVLSVFTGTARVQKAGTTTAATAHSGDLLADGDSVSTGADSKAAITYPDGSVTRLDSVTRVVVGLGRNARGELQVGLRQTAGLTWNTVKKLAGAASFKVSGPNNAVAGVRGTRFGFYIERDAQGRTVVWIDVYDGVVAVSGPAGPPVTATANQRVNVRATGPPTAPVPIPDADRHLSFTVFNRAIEAVSGKPVAFAGGALSSGGSSPAQPVAADGRSDLVIVLDWPGSIFELTVTDPSGRVYAQPASTTSPIVVTVPKAARGTWRFSARDVTSSPNEPWWAIAGVRPAA